MREKLSQELSKSGCTNIISRYYNIISLIVVINYLNLDLPI